MLDKTYGELSITGFALNSPPKWGSGGDFVGRGKDIWWESTSVLIFPSASVCSDLKALYKSVIIIIIIIPQNIPTNHDSIRS